MIRKFVSRSLLTAACALPLFAVAEVVVIVHPGVNATGSKEDVAGLFMGKTTALGGVSLTPVDQAEGEDPREEFYEKAAGKTQAQMNAHWSRVVFTGKGQPPRVLDDDDAVKEAVAKDKSLIGYIDSDALDGTVKKVISVK